MVLTTSPSKDRATQCQMACSCCSWTSGVPPHLQNTHAGVIGEASYSNSGWVTADTRPHRTSTAPPHQKRRSNQRFTEILPTSLMSNLRATLRKTRAFEASRARKFTRKFGKSFVLGGAIRANRFARFARIGNSSDSGESA